MRPLAVKSSLFMCPARPKDWPSLRTQRATALSLPGSPSSSAEISTDGIISRGDAAEASKSQIEFVLKMGLAAELLGAAAMAHAISLDYLRTRRQFNRLIGAFQALQFAAVDCYVRIEATRSLIYKVANSEGDPDERGALASGVKAKADVTALSVTTTGVQMHGALGFTSEHDIGLFLKRAVALRATMGPPSANIERYSERKNRGPDCATAKALERRFGG